ncbi:hypothetical protein MKW98_001449 [Papaver atlanticum]|uniref:CCR4-NOT transcription complex subunit 1 CAF1-binding domain-containing protein n=1 Tax=Papaver atlanticum TaxID=357466 RepID=A0AAD4SWY5_9MAGN|nr:hypothetical protein MKW98_001449 [Papaver atlanticum]
MWNVGLLAEIYALPNLKMNLKFDIEDLMENLGVGMKDVKPTSLLKDRDIGNLKEILTSPTKTSRPPNPNKCRATA